jgi:PhnB protein
MATLAEENRDLRRKVAQLEQALGRATFDLSQRIPGPALLAGRAAACSDVTVAITVSNPPEAIDFYSEVLGAREVLRVNDKEGKIAHAALVIGDSVLFINGEYPEVGRVSPTRLAAGGNKKAKSGASPSSVALHVFVNDAKTAHRNALKAGCKEVLQPREEFWGDVRSTLTDPFGHHIVLSTNKESVAATEINSRAEREFGPQH